MLKRPVQSKDYGRHVMGMARDLSHAQEQALIELIHRPVGKAASVLGGRSSVAIDTIDGIGRVAVKHFTRGGLLHFVVAKRYLRFGKTRSQLEYELMQKVSELGVNAPETIAYIYQGHLFYRAWLVTKEIEMHKSLAELSSEDQDRAEDIMKALVPQVEILIRNKIFHIDLHPGNVLIDANNKVYLVDFDKACIFTGKTNLLRDKYLCRWRRAIIKHELQEVLSELMCAGLRKNFE